MALLTERASGHLGAVRCDRDAGRSAGVRGVFMLVATVVALSCAPRDTVAADLGSKESGAAITAELVLRALSLLGVSYRYGGNTPESGLDCSGLVRYVFHEAAGLPLPRRAEEMSRVGAHVNDEELRPGDLVFFNTLRRAFSHVGIYIGERRFVHAPSSGGNVTVETIDRAYWQRRFNGGRRLLALGEEAPGEHGNAHRITGTVGAVAASRPSDQAEPPRAAGNRGPDPAPPALYQN